MRRPCVQRLRACSDCMNQVGIHFRSLSELYVDWLRVDSETAIGDQRGIDCCALARDAWLGNT
jgi:hypothetical protein